MHDILEPVGLDREDGNYLSMKLGRALIWDVAVVETLDQLYVAATSQQAGAAADGQSGRFFSFEIAVVNKRGRIKTVIYTRSICR